MKLPVPLKVNQRREKRLRKVSGRRLKILKLVIFMLAENVEVKLN